MLRLYSSDRDSAPVQSGPVRRDSGPVKSGPVRREIHRCLFTQRKRCCLFDGWGRFVFQPLFRTQTGFCHEVVIVFCTAEFVSSSSSAAAALSQ